MLSRRQGSPNDRPPAKLPKALLSIDLSEHLQAAGPAEQDENGNLGAKMDLPVDCMFGFLLYRGFFVFSQWGQERRRRPMCV